MTTLSIQLTPADQFNGTLLHNYQRARQLGFASGIAVLVSGGYSIVWAIAPGYAPTAANLAFFYAALLAFLYAVQRSWLAWRTRRLFATGEYFRRPYEFAFSDSGVTIVVDGARGDIAWPDFLKWREGANVFLLYRAQPLYQIVPKHAVASAREIDQFRRLLLTQIAA